MSTKSASVVSNRVSVSLTENPGPAGSKPLKSENKKKCRPLLKGTNAAEICILVHTGDSWQSTRYNGGTSTSHDVGSQTETNQVKRTQRSSGVYVKEIDKSPRPHNVFVRQLFQLKIIRFLTTSYPVCFAASGRLRMMIKG